MLGPMPAPSMIPPWVRAAGASLLGGSPRHRVLLLGLFMLHLIANWLWWAEDLELVWLDESWHFIDGQYARTVYRHLGLGGLLQWVASPSTHLNPFWPLARTLPGVALAELVQPSWVAFRLVGTLFFFGLLAALYLLGRRLWSRSAGLTAAALASFYPMLFGASRHITPDIIGCAFVAGNLYLLLATNRFTRPRPTLLLGLGIGAGFLFRPHYPIFFVAPLCVHALLSLLYKPGLRRSRLLLHMGGCALLTVAAAAPFWWGALPTFFSYVQHHVTGDIAASFPTDDRSALAYYLRVMPNGASPAVFYLSAAAALSLLLPPAWRRLARAPGRRMELGLVLLGGATGFAFLCNNPHNVARYLAPLYPLLALFAAVGLHAALPRRARGMATAALLLAAGGTWLACSFSSWRPHDRLLICEPCWAAEQTGPVESAGPPVKEGRFAAVVELLEELRRRHGDDGDGVLLELHPPPARSPATLFVTLPVMYDLAGIKLVDDNAPGSWKPAAPTALFRSFGGQVRQRYTLVHEAPRDHKIPSWPVPPDARLVRRVPAAGAALGEGFSLWSHPAPGGAPVDAP